MSYFLKAFDFCKRYSPEAKVYFFFHKIDPKYTGDINFDHLENEFISEVLPKIQNQLDQAPGVFHTSIHTPFTVIRAFSQPLLDNFTIYETISKTIKQFVVEHEYRFGILFCANFFEIGHYIQHDRFESTQELITRFLKEYDVRGFEGTFPRVSLGFAKIFNQKFLVPVGPVDFPFYLSVGIDIIDDSFDEDAFQVVLTDFIKDIRKILENSELIRVGILRTENLIKTAYFDDY